MCVVKEWFSEERNGLRMETKRRSRSWSGKAEQEPRHRERVLGGGTRKAQLQTSRASCTKSQRVGRTLQIPKIIPEDSLPSEVLPFCANNL